MTPNTTIVEDVASYESVVSAIYLVLFIGLLVGCSLLNCWMEERREKERVRQRRRHHRRRQTNST